jgi:hypothetical protein
VASLRGSLREFSLHDVLSLLGSSMKTGALVLEGSSASAAIYTTDGLVAHAHLGEDDALDALVRAQIVDLAQVEAAVAEPGGWTDALLRRSRADRAALGSWLRERVEDALFQVLSWDDGTFEFRAGETNPAGGGCAFEVEPLVASAYRKVDTWREITSVLPSMDDVVAVERWLPGRAPSVTLNAEEWYVLSAIDGRRSLREIARELGETLFAVAQTARAMVDGGLVRVDTGSGSDAASVAAVRPFVAALAEPAPLDLDAPVAVDELADELLADPAESAEPDGEWSPIGMREAAPAEDDTIVTAASIEAAPVAEPTATVEPVAIVEPAVAEPEPVPSASAHVADHHVADHHVADHHAVDRAAAGPRVADHPAIANDAATAESLTEIDRAVLTRMLAAVKEL